MATAKKLASGSYRCLVYIGKDASGKRIYKSFTHRDKRKCERMADEYADLHRGTVNRGSLESAIMRLITQKEPVLSPATIRGYKNILAYLQKDFPDLCKMPIYNLTKSDLQKTVDKMASEGAKPKTISNRMGLISSVLKESDLPVPSISLPRKERADLKIPDTKDVERIIKIAEGTEMEIPILLAAFGPMRRSEIVALTMDDIDGNTIHVRKAVVMDSEGKNVVKTTKTYDSNRYIPMPEDIIRKIREKGYITDITNPQIISHRFQHIAKRAGCEGTRFHDLRHWCASYLHANGVPDMYILARGGWRTDRVMKTIYRHELESEKTKWTKKIVKDFKNIMQSEC